ncbi:MULTISPECIES: glycosyltransferase family 2 protein [Aequorivita]|uniref:Glycosyltransferase family 2 protein n=1 Tax=Aequorivita iocasae TaxID=2803865 RepID=A0ABX7DT11_9FLAO|nr:MULTISPECIES: glycosyltransferase family 2 protein [Aequorivita]QQX76756.1 glycosyltransferase family 2 protein [Aequorivita iocasae]UCA56227.1 glycosyltransferase family 2 protein [Aequorivita sp. F7]
MKTSLLISTYNWPQALELVLLSAQVQSEKPDEILIADDGSTEETKTLIDGFRKKTPYAIKHFWHEDKGFRKAIILNKAIAKATGEYIIQIDGDCIMHRDFVKDHKAMAQENAYLYGSRENIQEHYLPTLFREKKIAFSFFAEGIKKRTRNLRIPLFSRLYGTKNSISKKMRGCNVSFWKKDVVAVNGYNEEFEGWGREDSELIIRMMNNGVLGKRLRYRGIVYHIWHKVKDQSRFKMNDSLQEKAIAEKSKWCKNGIEKYL